MSLRRMMIFTLGAKIKNLVLTFKERVFGNSGQFEAEDCLNNTLEDMGIDLFEQASLVVTPNGYKENVLYSVTPSPVGTNLLLRSEEFDNSYWSKNLGTITANDTITPSGTMTADLFTKTSAVNTVSTVWQTTVTKYLITGIHTLSVYIKPKVGNIVLLRLDGGGNSANGLFNFTTKTFTNTGVNVMSSSYEELPDGWFRLSLTANVTNIAWAVDVCNLFNNPTGDAMWLWGAQLEYGATAGNYIQTTYRQAINETICDFNVVRATTGTRVNSDGLIEVVPYNLVSYSEECDNNLWVKGDGGGIKVNVIPNQTIAPNGSLTADLVIPTTDYKEHPINPIISLSSLGVNRIDLLNWSTYVKPAGNNFFILRTNLNNSWVPTIFNIENGTIVSTHPNFVSSNITNSGNGWYRISVVTENMTNYDSFQMISTPTGAITFSGDGVSGAYMWGTQVTRGEILKDYFPTTNKLNIPRIDYSGGGCPSILVEPQRSNYFINNSYSDKNNTTNNTWLFTRKPNQGIYGLDSIEGVAQGGYVSGQVQLRYIFSLPAGNYTHTFYVKKNCDFSLVENNGSSLLNQSGQSQQVIYIDSTTGVITPHIGITQYSSEDKGDWWKISYVVYSSGGNSYFDYQPNGVGTNFEICGSQIEFGIGSTSFIPTLTSVVTRNADVISKTGISDLIGQTEGSVYLELSLANLNLNGRTFITLFLNSINWVRFRIQTESLSNINIQTEWYVNSVFVNQGNANIPRSTSLNKILFTYKIGSQVNFFHNGVKLITTNPVITEIPAFNQINLGSNNGQLGQINEGINLASIFKTALTDEQAINLTTL